MEEEEAPAGWGWRPCERCLSVRRRPPLPPLPLLLLLWLRPRCRPASGGDACSGLASAAACDIPSSSKAEPAPARCAASSACDARGASSRRCLFRRGWPPKPGLAMPGRSPAAGRGGATGPLRPPPCPGGSGSAGSDACGHADPASGWRGERDLPRAPDAKPRPRPAAPADDARVDPSSAASLSARPSAALPAQSGPAASPPPPAAAAPRRGLPGRCRPALWGSCCCACRGWRRSDGVRLPPPPPARRPDRAGRERPEPSSSLLPASPAPARLRLRLRPRLSALRRGAERFRETDAPRDACERAFEGDLSAAEPPPPACALASASRSARRCLARSASSSRRCFVLRAAARRSARSAAALSLRASSIAPRWDCSCRRRAASPDAFLLLAALPLALPPAAPARLARLLLRAAFRPRLVGLRRSSALRCLSIAAALPSALAASRAFWWAARERLTPLRREPGDRPTAPARLPVGVRLLLDREAFRRRPRGGVDPAPAPPTSSLWSPARPCRGGRPLGPLPPPRLAAAATAAAAAAAVGGDGEWPMSGSPRMAPPALPVVRRCPPRGARAPGERRAGGSHRPPRRASGDPTSSPPPHAALPASASRSALPSWCRRWLLAAAWRYPSAAAPAAGLALLARARWLVGVGSKSSSSYSSSNSEP